MANYVDRERLPSAMMPVDQHLSNDRPGGGETQRKRKGSLSMSGALMLDSNFVARNAELHRRSRWIRDPS